MEKQQFDKYVQIITDENCSQKDVNLCVAAFITHGLSDEQIDFLERKASENKNITSLTLENINITDEGADLLVKLLNIVKDNIKILILQTNKLGYEGVKNLLGFIKENKSLEDLSFAWNDDYAINCRELSKALENNNLKSLNLAHCEIGNNNFKLLSDTLKDQRLKILDLSGNSLNAKSFICLLESFENNQSLEVLRLKSNNIEGENLNGQLKVFLENNKTLIELDLASNKLGYKGAKEISKSLKTNRTLKKINLTDNNIGDEGLKKILESLPDDANIEELSIANNNITDEGAIALAGAIKRGVKISRINLKNNEITDEGARHLADALTPNKFTKDNRKATELDLNDNKINNKTLLQEIEGVFTGMKLPNIDVEKMHLHLPSANLHLPPQVRARRRSSPAAISPAYAYKEEIDGKGKEEAETPSSKLFFGASFDIKNLTKSKGGSKEYHF